MSGNGEFTWRSSERTVVFGRDALARAHESLAGQAFGSYELVSTDRALAGAPPGLTANADAVHVLGPEAVPEAAAKLLDAIGSRAPALVAFGGGRVVDAAKSAASVSGSRVAAIPTTLAGSATTGIHRPPAGRESEVRGLVRPVLVIADPAAMTSAAEPQLRATAMNALAHGSESLYAPGRNPVSEVTALRGARLLATSLDLEPGRRDVADLATGALLCAAAIDSTGIALHHAVCQTLVRVMALPHAETNATMLPHTMAAMTHRAPHQISELAGALGVTAGGIGHRIEELSGGPRHLGEIGADKGKIDDVLDQVEARGDTATNTPNPPDREAIRGIILEAW